MEQAELHSAVARAISGWIGDERGEALHDQWAGEAAAAAIGVVLTEATHSIEVLPRFEGGGLLRSNGAWVSRRQALAVLAALEPPPPV